MSQRRLILADRRHRYFCYNVREVNLFGEVPLLSPRRIPLFALAFFILAGVLAVATHPAATDSVSLATAMQAKGVDPANPRLVLVVDKSEHTLAVFSGRIWLKSYRVGLGDGGPGAKQLAGDHKTPEGRFYVSQRSVIDPPDPYLGSRWLRLSYPTREDAERGLNHGLISWDTYLEINAAVAAMTTPPQYTSLGGGIGIHGGSVPEFGDDWTWGCIGLTNQDIEELYPYVGTGTPVVINP